jgi:hypothetical protein
MIKQVFRAPVLSFMLAELATQIPPFLGDESLHFPPVHQQRE